MCPALLKISFSPKRLSLRHIDDRRYSLQFRTLSCLGPHPLSWFLRRFKSQLTCSLSKEPVRSDLRRLEKPASYSANQNQWGRVSPPPPSRVGEKMANGNGVGGGEGPRGGGGLRGGELSGVCVCVCVCVCHMA